MSLASLGRKRFTAVDTMQFQSLFAVYFTGKKADGKQKATL